MVKITVAVIKCSMNGCNDLIIVKRYSQCCRSKGIQQGKSGTTHKHIEGKVVALFELLIITGMSVVHFDKIYKKLTGNIKYFDFCVCTECI